eukprot:993581-Pelagomonas_calceolata.AAC.1
MAPDNQPRIGVSTQVNWKREGRTPCAKFWNASLLQMRLTYRLHEMVRPPKALHLIGTILALNCGWHYELPEHMFRFV